MGLPQCAAAPFYTMTHPQKDAWNLQEFLESMRWICYTAQRNYTIQTEDSCTLDDIVDITKDEVKLHG